MDKQVKNLARQLGREGIAPERDLWPGIEKAIDGGSARPQNRSSASAWYRLAAVAATLVLLVGSGYFGGISPGTNPANHAALTNISEDGSHQDTSLLESLNNTISALDKAMAIDPDNIKLTRLSLMTHMSRANLLRVGTRR